MPTALDDAPHPGSLVSRGKADDGTIASAKCGDLDAWRTLYQAYAGRLLAWLRTMPTGDAGVTAEDLAADVWVTATTRIVGFHGSSDEFAGWLFGIGRLKARNAVRRSARRRTSPTAPASLQLVGAVHAPPDRDDQDGEAWIAWCLDRLPPRERQVVAAIDVADLDVTSTATLLHLSTSAVRAAHHRALRRLRGLPGLAGEGDAT